jgi:FAD/FMN-containing dehydrogenase
MTATQLDAAGIPTAVLEGGDGPPLLLLADAGHWSRAIPLLVDGHRVIVPELPSEPERVLQWLGELIDATCPEPPVLVGHALGGDIAARFAAHNGGRIARLVLVGTPIEDLDRIAVPTMLIWGRHDLATPLAVAEAAGERHGWPLRVIEDCADPPVEQPAAFVEALLKPWLWNGMVEAAPAHVIRPKDTAGVVRALALARERDLRVAVRGGGHNIAGAAVAQLTLDMAELREVAVDPVARTATVQPGCTLGEVDLATQRHGLATPLGFVSDVGVAGLTLGGGLGYLTRRFGWTVDNLLEVEIVTADGAVRRASRDRNPDLFWAIRGGGAFLGVVTSFTFRLHEVGPAVVGGLIAWPFDRAREILRAYREITAGAPRELAVWLTLFRAPPAPFVPEPVHGERICAMAVCFSGDLERAGEVLAPIRALGDPVFDMLAEQPYTEVQSYLDATEPAGEHYYWKTGYLAELSDDFLATWHDLAAALPVPDGELGLLHVGGALNEHAGDDGAVGNRDARYVCGALGMWPPGDPAAAAHRQWIRSAWERFRPFTTGGSYINFQTGDEGEDRVPAAFGANYDRLALIKEAYDPAGRFRVL